MPLPTLGILGGGQLGRMMALAAIRMGIGVRSLAPSAEGPMNGLGHATIGDWNDPQTLRDWAEGCDVVTVESEWAPADRLAPVLPAGTRLFPRPETLAVIRDKGLQKQRLLEAGLPAAAFRLCPTLQDATEAAEAFGLPVMLKRLRGSYDGYGNATIRKAEEIEQHWPELAEEDGLLVEAWVPFRRELSVLVARREDGEQVVYPVAHTEQRDHRCHAVTVPASISAEVAARATEIGLAAVEAVDGVGLTAVELFELEDGTICINELAPRPHNTGHYSIEGCHTSQFENHVRAVLGLPLGSPALRAPVSVMVNILGTRSGEVQATGYEDALKVEGVAIHLYGKQSVRPNRKMGHVTATGTGAAEVRARAEQAASLILT